MRQSRIETNLLGFKLRSPVIIAASFLTRDMRMLRLADEHGAGGVSTKAVFPHRPPILPAPHSFKPGIFVLPRGMGIIATGDRRLELEEGMSLVREIKRESDMFIMGCVSGAGERMDEWQRLSRGLEEAGADALELAFSHPRVGSRGIFIAKYPDLTEAVVRAVKSVVSIPVTVKLTPITSDLGEVAQACERGGADAITLMNAMIGASPVDIWNEGKSRFLTQDKHNWGALAGPAIFPIACYSVALASKAVKIPVIGCGGVSTWEDVVEMIMWGASAVQICTAIILHGFDVVSRINEGLEDFMEKKGYSSVEDFRGLALEQVVADYELEFKDVRLAVDRERCDLCKRCLSIGQCLALSLRNGEVVLDNAECIQCGTCVTMCPRQAIKVIG